MEKRFWSQPGPSSRHVGVTDSVEKTFQSQSGSSSSTVRVISSEQFIEVHEVEPLDKPALVSRLNNKLSLVNQKMSILLDNSEDLNLKKSKIRALVREVLLEEKLKQNN